MARRNLFTKPGAVGLETALYQRIEVAVADADVAEMVFDYSFGKKGRKKRKRKLKLRREELD